MSHDIKLKTALPYERLEHLLEACCTKLYSMTLDDIIETKSGPRKVIRISFEDATDCDRFRDTFRKSRDQVPPVLGASAFNDNTQILE